MPWGDPDHLEARWCVGCGAIGTEWMEARILAGAPTPRVRLCPPCWFKGWRLVGRVQQGVFYMRGLLRRIRAREAA